KLMVTEGSAKKCLPITRRLIMRRCCDITCNMVDVTPEKLELELPIISSISVSVLWMSPLSFILLLILLAAYLKVKTEVRDYFFHFFTIAPKFLSGTS